MRLLLIVQLPVLKFFQLQIPLQTIHSSDNHLSSQPVFHTGIRTANTRLATSAQKFLDNLFWECKWEMAKNEIFYLGYLIF